MKNIASPNRNTFIALVIICAVVIIFSFILKEMGITQNLIITPKSYGIPYIDKIAHFGIVGFLTFLLTFYFNFPVYQFGKHFLPKVMFWMVVLTSLDEVSQFWRLSRSMDAVDWSADLLGAIVFTAMAYWLRKKAVLRRNQPSQIQITPLNKEGKGQGYGKC